MLIRVELKDFSLNMIFLANYVQSFIDHTTCVIFASFHQGKEEEHLCLFFSHFESAESVRDTQIHCSESFSSLPHCVCIHVSENRGNHAYLFQTWKKPDLEREPEVHGERIQIP